MSNLIIASCKIIHWKSSHHCFSANWEWDKTRWVTPYWQRINILITLKYFATFSNLKALSTVLLEIKLLFPVQLGRFVCIVCRLLKSGMTITWTNSYVIIPSIIRRHKINVQLKDWKLVIMLSPLDGILFETVLFNNVGVC